MKIIDMHCDTISELADFRLRQAKKYHMDDVQQELRPIIARARKAVIKGELPLKEKLRFLGEHYYYVLRAYEKSDWNRA